MRKKEQKRILEKRKKIVEKLKKCRLQGFRRTKVKKLLFKRKKNKENCD